MMCFGARFSGSQKPQALSLDPSGHLQKRPFWDQMHPMAAVETMAAVEISINPWPPFLVTWGSVKCNFHIKLAGILWMFTSVHNVHPPK